MLCFRPSICVHPISVYLLTWFLDRYCFQLAPVQPWLRKMCFLTGGDRLLEMHNTLQFDGLNGIFHRFYRFSRLVSVDCLVNGHNLYHLRWHHRVGRHSAKGLTEDCILKVVLIFKLVSSYGSWSSWRSRHCANELKILVPGTRKQPDGGNRVFTNVLRQKWNHES